MSIGMNQLKEFKPLRNLSLKVRTKKYIYLFIYLCNLPTYLIRPTYSPIYFDLPT
jgi:hypothetical protein